MLKEKAIEKDAKHAVKCGVFLLDYLRGCVAKDQSALSTLEYTVEVESSGSPIIKRNLGWNSHSIHSEIKEIKIASEKEAKDPEHLKLLDKNQQLDEEIYEKIKQKPVAPPAGPIIIPALCFSVAAIIIVAEAYQFALPYLNYIGVDIKALNVEMETNPINVVSGFLFAGVVAIGLFFVAHTIMKIILNGDLGIKRIIVLFFLTMFLVSAVYGVSALRHGLSQEAVGSADGGVSTIIFVLISIIGLYAAAFCSKIGLTFYEDRVVQKFRRGDWKSKLTQHINALESIKARKAVINKELDAKFASNKKEASLVEELRIMQRHSQNYINTVVNDCILHKKYFIRHAHLTSQTNLINLNMD